MEAKFDLYFRNLSDNYKNIILQMQQDFWRMQLSISKTIVIFPIILFLQKLFVLMLNCRKYLTFQIKLLMATCIPIALSKRYMCTRITYIWKKKTCWTIKSGLFKDCECNNINNLKKIGIFVFFVYIISVCMWVMPTAKGCL